MNSQPSPPLLPGRAPDARQKVLNVILAALIVVFAIVSGILALVMWKISSTTPPKVTDRVFPAPASAIAPVLQIQSQRFNIVRGEDLVIAGSGAVEIRNGDHLAISDAASLRPPDAMTVSAWFNARSFEKPMTVAGRAQNGPPWRYPFLSWLVRINNDSLVEIDVGHEQNYTPSGWNVPPLQPGEWNFVAMTYDGRIKKLFLNGSLITSLASGSPNSQNSIRYAPGRFILIGADESEAPVGDRFDGAIDDVRLYDRALLVEEMQRVFQEGKRRLPVRRR